MILVTSPTHDAVEQEKTQAQFLDVNLNEFAWHRSKLYMFQV